MPKNFPKLMTDTKTVPREAPGDREMTLPLVLNLPTQISWSLAVKLVLRGKEKVHVRVSQNCCNKLPQTCWHKITQFYNSFGGQKFKIR